jgi:hypothetical protein
MVQPGSALRRNPARMPEVQTHCCNAEHDLP